MRSHFERSVEDHYGSLAELFDVQVHLNLQFATEFGLACPSESDWPNCAIPSQEIMARSHSLLEISEINQFVVSPIVLPDERASFEAFALNYYTTDGGYPDGTGTSGIFDLDSNFSPIKSPNHTNPEVSQYDFLVPILMVSDIAKSSHFLLNSYASPLIMNVMNDVLDCANTSHHIEYHNESSIQHHCTATTDHTPSRISEYSGLIFTPLVPINDPMKVVGFIGAMFSWQAIISASRIKDFDFQCELRSSELDEGHRYLIHNGIAKEIDEIKTYDHSSSIFSKPLKKTYTLETVGISSNTVYTITYYSTSEAPSDQFATFACVSCVIVTLVISVIFVIFDILISRETAAANMLLDSKRTYVRFVSHEIRTPLNTIILSIRLLSETLQKLDRAITPCPPPLDLPPDLSDLSPLVEDCFDLISDLEENSSIAVMTLNDLINYDKIETRSFSIEKKDVDFWTVLEKTVKPLVNQAREKSIRMEFVSQVSSPFAFPESDVPLHNLRLIGDSIKLGQVVRNLVSNALKFTPANGEVKITASYNPQESPLSHTPRRPSHSYSRVLPVDHDQLSELPVGHIILTVTDTGPGLTLEQQQSLFREGVQFNPNELQAGQGSGLGLWISKEIVSLHQGKIHVSSPGIGCGSTFEVSLPVVLRHSPVNSLRQCISRRQQGGAEEVTPQSALSDGSITSNPPCALIVDDAPSNRKVVSRLLKSRGFVCHEVENGQECVDLVTSGSPHFDLILMDYEMPVMDGPTAARKLRELKSEVLIIGLTGNVLPEDQKYFQKQGANLVLSKPLNIDKLLDHFHLFQKNPQHLV